MQLYLTDPAVKTTPPRSAPPADIEIRFKYNQDFESIYAMVPSTMSMLLALFPAILMALAIVREKELGSITNLYVTPVTRHRISARQADPLYRRRHDEFRADVPDGAVRFSGAAEGQLPRAAVRRALLCHDDDRLRHADFGLRPTQIAAMFGTAILTVLPATQFSGMLVPVSSLSGIGADHGPRLSR